MGIQAKHLLDRTNALTVTVTYEENGQQVEGALTVRHRVLTPELWAQLKTGKPEAKKKPKDSALPEERDSLVSELLALVTEWDVEGEDGKPLPITEETLRRIDYLLLKEINKAIFAYTFPNLTT